MVYERPGYSGYQYFLKKGDYPDYHRWMGFNDCVRSCRLIPTVDSGSAAASFQTAEPLPITATALCSQQHQSSHRLTIYERPEFGGRPTELTDDCASLSERFRSGDVHSCNVRDGNWIFYEHPNYRGRQYLVRPGEYRRSGEWGGASSRVGSIRRVAA